jgi:hypothetical protein
MKKKEPERVKHVASTAAEKRMPQTKEQREARKWLKKSCPAMFESETKKQERHARLVAMFKSPLFTEFTEEDRIAGEELQRALAEAHGYDRS